MSDFDESARFVGIVVAAGALLVAAAIFGLGYWVGHC